MVFKNICALVLWMKVALALEGLTFEHMRGHSEGMPHIFPNHSHVCAQYLPVILQSTDQPGIQDHFLSVWTNSNLYHMERLTFGCNPSLESWLFPNYQS